MFVVRVKSRVKKALGCAQRRQANWIPVESRCDGQVGLISTFFDFARSITCKIARSEPTPMTDVRSGNVCSLVDVVCMTFWKQTSCAVFAPGFHLGLHDIVVTFLRIASNSRAATHGINRVAV